MPAGIQIMAKAIGGAKKWLWIMSKWTPSTIEDVYQAAKVLQIRK
jgi:hypothetical protein